MNFEIEPLDDVKQFSTFTADIDLTAAATSPAAAVRGHARWLRVETAGAGTLAVKLTGSGGTVRTLTVTDGFELTGKFTEIDVSSDLTLLTVGW